MADSMSSKYFLHLKNRYYTSTWPIHETVKNFEKGKSSVSTYGIWNTQDTIVFCARWVQSTVFVHSIINVELHSSCLNPGHHKTDLSFHAPPSVLYKQLLYSLSHWQILTHWEKYASKIWTNKERLIVVQVINKPWLKHARNFMKLNSIYLKRFLCSFSVLVE